MPPEGPDPKALLQKLDRLILQQRGAEFEGDLFSVLRLSPYSGRSFEFALGDGFVDCTREYDPNATWADRLWQLEQSQRFEPAKSQLLLFDVKSSLSADPASQIFYTTSRQEQGVAFYLGVCAADPSFVELIPNGRQLDRSSMPVAAVTEPERDLEQKAMVNTARISHLPTTRGTLNPCDTPYRMPLGLLLEAIRRVRRTVTHGDVYVNPWTLVRFPTWKASTTSSLECLLPREDTPHFTSYLAIREMHRQLKVYASARSMYLDFIGLQPRLADFKLVDSSGRQVFVQDKIEYRVRSVDSLLTNVEVGRLQRDRWQWYFESHHRFDFLCYHFFFQSSTDLQTVEVIYFIPERELPDAFYSDTVHFHTFERPEWMRYRIVFDAQGRWIERVRQIVASNPRPRAQGPRPLRAAPVEPPAAESPAAEQVPPTEPSPLLGTGRTTYKAVLDATLAGFYRGILQWCAYRRSGLLIALAPGHPLGDMAFCRYTWTPEEYDAFVIRGVSPCNLDRLPPQTPLLPLTHVVSDRESSHWGPSITTATLRRLRSSAVPRLIVLHFGGRDTSSCALPVAVIPSDDLSMSTEQEAIFAKNSKPSGVTNFHHRNPSISAMLHRDNLIMPDYMVGSKGPLAYGQSIFSAVGTRLASFSGTQAFKFPAQCQRQPTVYQHSACEVSTRLLEDFAAAGILVDAPSGPAHTTNSGID